MADKDGEVSGRWGGLAAGGSCGSGDEHIWIDSACSLHTSAGSLDGDSGWWSSRLHVQAFVLQESIRFSLYVHRSQ